MPVPGFVYVLTNAVLPDFIKVGMSNDVERRLLEINLGAGVVGRWCVYGTLLVADMRRLEAIAHNKLAPQSLKNSVGTEIFKCSDAFAAQAIRSCANQAAIKIYEDNFPPQPEQMLSSSLPAAQDASRLRVGSGNFFDRFGQAARPIAFWARAVKDLQTAIGQETDPYYTHDLPYEIKEAVEYVANSFSLSERHELYRQAVRARLWTAY